MLERQNRIHNTRIKSNEFKEGGMLNAHFIIWNDIQTNIYVYRKEPGDPEG